MEITKEHENDHLEAQKRLSYLTGYHKWSLNYLGNKLGNYIWDAGAGTGLLADYLCTLNFKKLLLTEYTEENLKILQQKYTYNENIHVQFCDLLNTKSNELKIDKIDTVILLDVVEHLENDLKGLKLIYDRLEPNGHLLIKTPAHQSLYCGIDEASLHYRRYSKKELKIKLEQAGFMVKKIKYMNMPGAILYFIKGKILKKKTNFSRTISENNLSWINRAIPLISTCEKILPKFFGLSVIAIAEKPSL